MQYHVWYVGIYCRDIFGNLYKIGIGPVILNTLLNKHSVF